MSLLLAAGLTASCGPALPANPVVISGPHHLLKSLGQAQVGACKEGQVRSSSVWVEDVDETALFMQPPCRVVFPLKLEDAVVLETAISLDGAAWEIPGDGVTFYVAIRTRNRFDYLLVEPSNPHWIESDRKWKPVEVDLTAYVGETIELTLGTDPGPYSDNTGDFAVWKDPFLWNPLRDQRPKRVESGPISVRAGMRLLELLPQARILPHDPSRPDAFVRQDKITLNGVSSPILYEHPISKVVFKVKLAEPLVLETAMGLQPQAWNQSDGVVFSLILSDGDQVRTLARDFIDPRGEPKHRGWVPLRVDLTPYQGKTVKLLFATEAGPSGLAAYDWAAWRDPRFVRAPVVRSAKRQP